MDKKIVIDFEITSEGLYQIIGKESVEKATACDSINEVLQKAIIEENESKLISKKHGF